MAPSALDHTRSPDWPTPSADATGDATGAAERGDDAGAPGDIEGVTTKAPAENGPARMAPALGAVTDGSDLFAQALLGARGGDEGRADGEGSPLSAELFARVSKALADPRRFSILEIIAAHGEIACQRLCCDLPVKQATVSHHVKELSLAGLVETRRDGQFVYYRYVPTVMRQYAAALVTRLQVH